MATLRIRVAYSSPKKAQMEKLIADFKKAWADEIEITEKPGWFRTTYVFVGRAWPLGMFYDKVQHEVGL